MTGYKQLENEVLSIDVMVIFSSSYVVLRAFRPTSSNQRTGAVLSILFQDLHKKGGCSIQSKMSKSLSSKREQGFKWDSRVRRRSEQSSSQQGR